jgi:hypothetical protein
MWLASRGRLRTRGCSYLANGARGFSQVAVFTAPLLVELEALDGRSIWGQMLPRLGHARLMVASDCLHRVLVSLGVGGESRPIYPTRRPGYSLVVTDFDHVAKEYDRIAPDYKESKQLPFRLHLEEYTTFRLLPDLTGRSVVDLACGEGIYTRKLMKRGARRVVGVDISAEMIALARRAEAEVPIGVEYLLADVRQSTSISTSTSPSAPTSSTTLEAGPSLATSSGARLTSCAQAASSLAATTTPTTRRLTMIDTGRTAS